MHRAATAWICAAASVLATPALAQKGLTLPPDGDNQRSWVTQQVGPVRLSIEYSSPDVHSPTGEDRTGKIWGTLVPWGMANLGFGTCGDQCPWRGGANENTVFTTSEDVRVQGQALPAGSYGLHFLPGQDEWTVIFSKDSTSWGSFFYDAKEDALRVQAKPRKGTFREWLTYEFTDRRPDRATVVLAWENLELPIEVTVDNAVDLWVEGLRRDLRTEPGFTWQGWQRAAQFTADNDAHLEQGLAWAQQAVSGQLGQANFSTLSTLARLQEATGKTAEAKATLDQALNHPTAGPLDLHFFARGLQAAGKNEEALRVFELNATRHKGVWPTELGLARGHAGVGHREEALRHARAAVETAPNPNAKQNAEAFLKQLEGGGG
jgi:hypothetical protein